MNRGLKEFLFSLAFGIVLLFLAAVLHEVIVRALEVM